MLTLKALAELTKRYFTSRGPATVKDFATWSGLTLTDCKKGIGLIKDYLTYEKPGDEYFFIPENVRSGKKRFRGFYLLPVYDELIMGYKDRSAFLQLRNSIKSKPEFKFDNTIFSDGQIAGTWKRTFKKSIELEYNFFKKPDEKQLRLLKKSIKRLKEFTGLEGNYS